ncbi:hypothetical protein [Pontibacter sp. H249]|uniref:hypothetical protein n=1 Tax=Pontibacter sp. H249 TaxID=3133420 RepID=UPI0030C3FB0A
MKTTLKTSLALLFGAVLLSSCEKCDTATTTELTEADIDWLSYTDPVPTNGKPDTIRFENEVEAEVKYIRSQLYSNSVPGEGYSFDDKCIEQLDTQASAVIVDVARKMPGMATYLLKRPNDFKVQVLVENLGTYDINTAAPTHATIDIDGKTYQNVYEINVAGNDTYNAGKLKKLYFNKDKGFIRIEFYGGKFLQLKQ